MEPFTCCSATPAQPSPRALLPHTHSPCTSFMSPQQCFTNESTSDSITDVHGILRCMWCPKEPSIEKTALDSFCGLITSLPGGGQSRLGQARQLLPLYALSPGPEGLRPAPASDRTSVPSPPCCPAAGEQGLAISESLLSFLNSLCSQPLCFVYEPRPGGKAARCSNTSRVCYVRPTIQLQILSEKKGN